MKGLFVAFALTFSITGIVNGSEPQIAGCAWSAAETTPAYGVLVLRKAIVRSELADLLGRVTNEHPSVYERRFELRAINREMDRLHAFEKSRVCKLSRTYGDLILIKVALQMELNDLLNRVSPPHPEVIKKRNQIVALEHELESILR